MTSADRLDKYEGPDVAVSPGSPRRRRRTRTIEPGGHGRSRQ
jgi:hypothetical protein